ncbi:DUF6370 family protein [Pedobacter sp.]|uniref:DUF6370 family protein n=1 Tax=Pedobacter sp. TaxID=1411316 RepID=UPI00396C5890
MKKLLFLLFLGLGLGANAQTKTKKAVSKSITNQVVEIACGECQFKMKGKSCDLAVRIDGKPYFVDGRKIDDFGNAHGDDGFCNAVSKANVTGKIIDGRFKAEKIELVKENK